MPETSGSTNGGNAEPPWRLWMGEPVKRCKPLPATTARAASLSWRINRFGRAWNSASGPMRGRLRASIPIAPHPCGGARLFGRPARRYPTLPACSFVHRTGAYAPLSSSGSSPAAPVEAEISQGRRRGRQAPPVPSGRPLNRAKGRAVQSKAVRMAGSPHSQPPHTSFFTAAITAW